MRKDSLDKTFISQRISRRKIVPRRFNEGIQIALRGTRYGVTLLELMVALGLLAMLLLVAWSLFDNLQKAEERSAGLANRVQVLRQIRTWVAEDLDQLVFPLNNLNDDKASSGDLYFIGDSTGFFATISPSLNPLPFLQDAFASPASVEESIAKQASEDEAELTSVYDTDQDRQVRAARRSPLALERISIEYSFEIQPGPFQNTALDSSEDLVYKLVRRERLPTAISQSSSQEKRSVSGDANFSPDSVPNADRQLTIRDLYRQTDETLDTQGPALRERFLDGIQKAQFQYFDGKAWSSDWDSRKQKGFPLAVAVQFDFPSRSKARMDKAQRKNEASELGQAEISSNSSFGTIDTMLAQQPMAQSEARDNQEYLIASASTEVTIVVATHYRDPKPTREESEKFGRNNTRSNEVSRPGRSP